MYIIMQIVHFEAFEDISDRTSINLKLTPRNFCLIT